MAVNGMFDVARSVMNSVKVHSNVGIGFVSTILWKVKLFFSLLHRYFCLT